MGVTWKLPGAADGAVCVCVDAAATAKVLLNNGADAHALNNEGATPLHIAARYDATATAEVLDNGADVNAKSNDGRTPLHMAESKDASATGRGIDYGLHVGKPHVAESKDRSATAEMLRRSGGRVNKRNGEENGGCILKALVGLGIMVLIGLLSC